MLISKVITPSKFIKLLQNALKSDLRNLEKKARDRIENNFNSKVRKEILISTLNNFKWK